MINYRTRTQKNSFKNKAALFACLVVFLLTFAMCFTLTTDENDAPLLSIAVSCAPLSDPGIFTADYLSEAKEELRGTINSTSKIVRGRYTKESYSRFVGAAKQANTTYHNASATLQEVALSIDALVYATEQLETTGFVLGVVDGVLLRILLACIIALLTLNVVVVVLANRAATKQR